METRTESLAVEFPRELNRVREVLKQYQEIGPAGVFGAYIIEDLIKRAEAAQENFDTVAMVRTYMEMKDLQ